MAIEGIEEFFEDKNANKEKEIIMSDTIKITATTVTPLLQISETGSQRKIYIYEEGQRGFIPIFSANGLRGALRRMATRSLLAASEKNKQITPEAFYLLTSGASLGKKSIDTIVTPQNETKVRAQFPILSIFGAGLSALEGKAAVASLLPSKEQERIGYTEEGKPYSLILGKDTFFRTDAIREEGLWRNLINIEDVKAWSQEYLKKVSEAKSRKKSGEAEKESDSHIQQPINMDFIIPGVKLTSSINTKYGWDFTDVETGCLVSALRDLSLRQIGSAKRIGFGLLDWTIEMDGEILFRTTCNPDYVLERNTVITKKGEERITAWEQWLSENSDKIDIADFKE